jgi:hypothetical protein
MRSALPALRHWWLTVRPIALASTVCCQQGLHALDTLRRTASTRQGQVQSTRRPDLTVMAESSPCLYALASTFSESDTVSLSLLSQAMT